MFKDGRANARHFGFLALAAGLMMVAVGAISGPVGAEEAVPPFDDVAPLIHPMTIDAEAVPARGVEVGGGEETAVPARTCRGAHGAKPAPGTVGTKVLDDSDEEGEPTGSKIYHMAMDYCIAGGNGC